MDISQFESIIDGDHTGLSSGYLTFNIIFESDFIGISYGDDCFIAEANGSLLKINPLDMENIERREKHVIMRTLMRALLDIDRRYKPCPSSAWVCIRRDNDGDEWRWEIQDVLDANLMER